MFCCTDIYFLFSSQTKPSSVLPHSSYCHNKQLHALSIGIVATKLIHACFACLTYFVVCNFVLLFFVVVECILLLFSLIKPPLRFINYPPGARTTHICKQQLTSDRFGQTIARSIVLVLFLSVFYFFSGIAIFLLLAYSLIGFKRASNCFDRVCLLFLLCCIHISFAA